MKPNKVSSIFIFETKSNISPAGENVVVYLEINYTLRSFSIKPPHNSKEYAFGFLNADDIIIATRWVAVVSLIRSAILFAQSELNITDEDLPF